jgi:hypothetical protein
LENRRAKAFFSDLFALGAEPICIENQEINKVPDGVLELIPIETRRELFVLEDEDEKSPGGSQEKCRVSEYDPLPEPQRFTQRGEPGGVPPTMSGPT